MVNLQKVASSLKGRTKLNLTCGRWRWPVGHPRGSGGSLHPSGSLNHDSNPHCLTLTDLTKRGKEDCFV